MDKYDDTWSWVLRVMAKSKENMPFLVVLLDLGCGTLRWIVGLMQRGITCYRGIYSDYRNKIQISSL